jgi:hypothetical protein
VAFPLANRSPANLSTALNQAVMEKQARQEKPVLFGYDNGSPMRFAGEEIATRIGGDGDFSRMANDKQDKGAQDHLKQWTKQFTSGMFSPVGPDAEEVA